MKKTNTHDLVLAALCAALTAVVAPFSIAIGPISLTLSVFAVLFTGAMLRPGWAFAAQVVYIAIGAIGLPVFSGFKSGPQVLLGATGGRLDHMLANISAAVYIAGHGGSCVREDRFNRVHVLRDGSLTLRGLKGQTLSVLSYTDEAQGVTLTGMKYPAKDYTMTSAFPIGVSNVVQSDECSVTVKRGVLLVIEEGVR